MHQRGYRHGALDDAVRAFERRGWLKAPGTSEIVVNEAALQFEPEKPARRPQPSMRKHHQRMPRGLFSP